MNANEGVIEGYAIIFNQKSKKLGNFYEIIDRHALDNVDLSAVKCLLDHDTSKVLGSVKNKTLDLSIDDKGLKFKVTIPDTTYAKDLYILVDRGDIDGCSFGFNVSEKDRSAQTVTKMSDGNYLRKVNKIEKLTEISIVSIPAYDNTVATIKRDYDQAIKQYELEKLNTTLELLFL
ncbi:HK97 family phage prohead protease [Enterococcus casseliflavus]|uniref:HK97 family phage prohead protease n=1 Tax=Enterococcus casseliflavus TaxID=37734 RepID=UPI001BD17168|nr:HK97 family phage prohead protease [Enterococcus casseliflavus]